MTVATPTCPSVVRRRAGEVAHSVVSRVADPATLDAAIAAARVQSAFADRLGWREPTVAGGYAGTALVLGAADRLWPGAGFDRLGHDHLARAVAAFEHQPYPGTSLYAGLAGLGYTAGVLAGGRRRYRRLAAAVDAELLPRVRYAVRRLDEAFGCPADAFDLVSGLTGVGVHLLARRGDPAADEALGALLAGLARLLVDRGEPRRWHTPAELAGEALQAAYPAGHHNCGLAHGLPGPLALLSIAVTEGCDVPGAADAVGTAAAWLREHRIDLPDGPDWPNGVGLDAPDDLPHAECAPGPGRAAWCYGAPGVARSLWLAGTALGDAGTRALALDAMRAVLARPAAERLLHSPTFCHGIAGLLTITAAFARDTGLPEFVLGAAAIADELVGHHDPDSILGYRDVEPDGVLVDQPALLDGAPGVALALMGVTAADAPGWDRLFLVS